MKITFQPNEGEPLVFYVPKPSFVIGRSPSCDVALAVEGLSRQHCQVDLKAGEVYLTDLGSTNGVFIDGRRIPPKTPVRYQLFLPLSIGSIPTVTIESGDTSHAMPDYAGLMIRAEQSAADNLTRTKVMPRTPKPRAPVGPAPSESKSNKHIINIVALLILVAGVVMFFQMERGTDASPAPTKPLNSAKNFNDNGHF